MKLIIGLFLVFVFYTAQVKAGFQGKIKTEEEVKYGWDLENDRREDAIEATRDLHGYYVTNFVGTIIFVGSVLAILYNKIYNKGVGTNALIVFLLIFGAFISYYSQEIDYLRVQDSALIVAGGVLAIAYIVALYLIYSYGTLSPSGNDLFAIFGILMIAFTLNLHIYSSFNNESSLLIYLAAILALTLVVFRIQPFAAIGETGNTIAFTTAAAVYILGIMNWSTTYALG